MAIALTRVRFTADDYHRLADAGILGEDDRVELIDGEIVRMSPVGAQHAGTTKKLNRLFNRTLGDAVVIGVQDPVRLGDDTEPEPDISVLRTRADFYTASLPVPAEILLLIRVADTSLLADRLVKIPRYARAGIPEVWLVDLDHKRIERHAGPAAEGYTDVTVIAEGQSLPSSVVQSVIIRANELPG
ncbi:MAG: Uma2 family endonuclease [Chloroflexota bacterium]